MWTFSASAIIKAPVRGSRSVARAYEVQDRQLNGTEEQQRGSEKLRYKWSAKAPKEQAEWHYGRERIAKPPQGDESIEQDKPEWHGPLSESGLGGPTRVKSGTTRVKSGPTRVKSGPTRVKGVPTRLLGLGTPATAPHVILRDQNAGRSSLKFPHANGATTQFHTSIRGPVCPPKVLLENLSESDLRQANKDPTVLGVVQEMPLELITPVDNDVATPGYSQFSNLTWGIEAVKAHSSPYSGSGTTVCVLDTGIDESHPAFRGVDITVADFTGSGPGDQEGHGTHCAGTIFGQPVDGKRIGVAPGIRKALIGKVFDGPFASSGALFQGMIWAAANQADVISMSLGLSFHSLLEGLEDFYGGRKQDRVYYLRKAIEVYESNVRMYSSIMSMIQSGAVSDENTLVVAASGNDSRRGRGEIYELSASSPASLESIMAVGAVGQTDAGLEVAYFSNTDPVVCAPGVGVESAQAGGGLVSLNGTSMACPHVAGVSLLWLQQMRERGIPISKGSVASRVRASTTNRPFVDGYDAQDYGDGLVQAPQV